MREKIAHADQNRLLTTDSELGFFDNWNACLPGQRSGRGIRQVPLEIEGFKKRLVSELRGD